MAHLAESEGARLRYLPSLGQPVRPHRDGRALAELVRLTRSFRPEIVHTHTAKAGFLARQAALIGARSGSRPALVHTYHGHVLEGYFGPAKTALYRTLERSLAKRTDVLVGVSRATVDDLVRLGVAPRERFRVIPLGLDLERYARIDGAARLAARRELGVGGSEVAVVFVGRVVPIKRLDVLLRAIADAAQSFEPLRLLVVGDGSDRPRLERLAAELGVSGRVDFLGYRRDLRPAFAAADIAALSSDNEGTPVSLIEAGAAGLPAVATDVGGVSEVVTPQTGELVANGNRRALAAALARFGADQELRARAGAAAREHVLAKYSADRLVGDVERLYLELVAQGDG
jgi:glycosyltransferase involved in cell wall biosynthesis